MVSLRISEGAMYFITQGNTQVYSPLGTFVVEQHDRGYEDRRSYRPEPQVDAYSLQQFEVPKA